MKKIEPYLDKITNKKILFVYPHPDDESVMAGGLIQVALSRGFQVTVLTLTEGNRGKIHINGRGRSVTEIRREEMAEAMSVLKVSDWVMWKFEDGKLSKRNNWRTRLRKFIEETKPGAVVTYDLSGVTGHPDHIALSLEILKLFREKRKIKLLWTSFVGKFKKIMVGKKIGDYLVEPNFELELKLGEAAKKWQAAFAHKSQRLAGYVGSPWWILMFAARREWYSEAKLDKRYKYRFTKFKI